MKSKILFSLLLLFSFSALAQSPTVASGGGDLNDYEKLKKAEVYIAQGKVGGKLSAAKDLLNSNKNWGDFDFWARVALAEVSVGLGDFATALRVTEQLPSKPDLDLNYRSFFYRKLYQRALIARKLALDASGKTSDAQVLSHRLWALFPDLSSSITVTGSSNINDKLDRLHVLYFTKNEDQIPLFISVSDIGQASVSHEEKCEAYFQYGMALKVLKRNEEALSAFRGNINNHCDGLSGVRSYYWKAKLEATLNQKDSAIATNREFLSKYPNHRYTDDAYYALWKLYTDKGDSSNADKALGSLARSAGDMKAKAFFDKGFDLYEKGNYSEAIKSFDSVLSGSPTPDESYPQALYWKARSLDKLKKKSGDALYARLKNEFPFSFYGVMASNRLGGGSASLSAGALAGGGGSGLLGVVDRLNAAGHHEEARNLLDYYTQLNPSSEKSSPAMMAKKWMDSQDYNRAMKIAQEDFKLEGSDILHKNSSSMMRAFYPYAYPEFLTEASRKTGLARSVFLGIMREESLFIPDIRSKAGAIGLMQVMPATGAIQARQMGLSGYATTHLEDPRMAILVGSGFFKKMVDNYNGSIPMAIMAYNAGPGNVNKWRASMGNLPLDEFVENIPFAETRGYIRRVLRSMQIYALLLDDKELKKSFFKMAVR